MLVAVLYSVAILGRGLEVIGTRTSIATFQGAHALQDLVVVLVLSVSMRFPQSLRAALSFVFVGLPVSQ